jgi:heme/copper-type cytochrome/quinol oxidase subunit 2
MIQPLADAIFWIAALACVVAEIAILRSTYVARGVERSSLVPASSRKGEVAWAIIPAIGLVVLLGSTWQKVQERSEAHDTMHHGQMMPGMSMQSPPSSSTRMQSAAPSSARH